MLRILEIYHHYMSTISFRSADRSLQMSNKTIAKEVIEKLFINEKGQLGSLTYIFCSDDFLLQMNRQYLKHDFYTDIITFGLSEPGEPIEAEVYISIDRVKENAKQRRLSFQNELCRVLFHGALHLCGYKDKKKSEIILMRAKEDQYLRLFEKRLTNA